MNKVLPNKIQIPAFLLRSVVAIKDFFRTPFPLWKAAILGFIFAGLFPLVIHPLLFLCSFLPFISYQITSNAYPWVATFLVGSIATLLYRRTNKAGFQKTLPQLTGEFLSLLLCAAALICSCYACYREHICMDGHMRHPPYPARAYASDLAWTFGLSLAALTLVRCRSRLSIFVATIGGFLISFRFLFGSFGGITPYF